MRLNTEIQRLISNGLTRQAVDTCTDWARKYRVMGKPIPGPWSSKYHPWTVGMQNSTAPTNVGMKSAQAAYTETCLNVALYNIDVKRNDVLYVLPNKTPDASDFSSARFDSALDLSPHLSELFNDTKNIGHKRAGSANLYIRGSKSKSGLISIPVACLFIDEFDRMDQHAVALAVERLSGQFEKLIWEISTPTIPHFGIHKEFLTTTQEHFFFPCPRCSRQTELIFPDCFELVGESLTDPRISESKIICKECKGDLTKDKWAYLQAGDWQPSIEKYNGDRRGFHINQLYSSTIAPYDIATSMIKAETSKAEEQELYNSKMGLPHTVEGAQVTDSDLDSCYGNYPMLNVMKADRLVTMGVDVGDWLHVEIDEWDFDDFGPDINSNAVPRVVHITKVRDFEALDPLMKAFLVRGCVVDINPERRKAKEFADRFRGFVRLAHYSSGQASKAMVEKADHAIVEDYQLSVDRTSWLDLSLGRFVKSRISLPNNTPNEYRENVKALVRVTERDINDNPVGRYQNIGPDHYAHARNYAEIALPLAASVATNSTIGDFL